MAWQKAQDLAFEMYRTFGSLKDFGFRDQILRASVSVSNNIAEGFGRKTNADFVRFLYISLGSCYEILSMLYLSERLCYTETSHNKQLIKNVEEVIRIIQGLIRHLKKHEPRATN